MRWLKRKSLVVLSYLFSEGLSNRLARLLNRTLLNELAAEATEAFLELLLRGMDLAFCLCRNYRRNIEGFAARYVFTTKDGAVAVTAEFGGEEMSVYKKALDNPTVKVSFTNTGALREFLFSEDQDILKSILSNSVEVDGNLNYIYKFGFMSKDLLIRLDADS